jgi:hypothetical protein
MFVVHLIQAMEFYDIRTTVCRNQLLPVGDGGDELDPVTELILCILHAWSDPELHC